MSVPLVTHGMIGGSGSGGGGGNAPEPSCIELNSIGVDWAKFDVIPPVPSTYYQGTYLLYGEITSCSYSQAGPEDGNGQITVPSLVSGMIYVFVPVAFGSGGARAKPGNVIMATVPINLVVMEQLECNSQGLQDVWTMIRQSVPLKEITDAIAELDRQLSQLTTYQLDTSERLERLKAQLDILRRKVVG